MIAQPPDFADFRALSAALGENPLLAQGAGGNTSIKHDGVMWIKASGTWLKDAASKDIFVAVDYAADGGGDAEPVYRRLDSDTKLRPSIEVSLHAVLPHRVIAHIHAVPVLVIAVRRDAVKLCSEKLSGLRVAYLPYVKPGWPLTQALRRALEPAVPDIFILGNHGLILGGADVAQIKSHLKDVDARLKTTVRTSPPADMKFLEQTCANGGWRLPKDSAVHALATDDISRAYATGGTLYPDHVVFLGRGCQAVAADRLSSIDPAKQPMILIEGKGVLLAANLPAAGEAMAECLAAVIARIPAGAELNYLSAQAEEELLNWDAEKYRQIAT